MSAESGSLFDKTLYLEKYWPIIRRKSVTEQRLRSEKKYFYFDTPFHFVSVFIRTSCLQRSKSVRLYLLADYLQKWLICFFICFFSLLWELPLTTNRPICQERRCQCLAMVSAQSTKWMKTGTEGAAVRAAAPLLVPARCRLSTRCLRWSRSISPSLLQLCAGPSVTSNLKSSTWKTVIVASAS